jgi:hypothetical protein
MKSAQDPPYVRVCRTDKVAAKNDRIKTPLLLTLACALAAAGQTPAFSNGFRFPAGGLAGFDSAGYLYLAGSYDQPVFQNPTVIGPVSPVSPYVGHIFVAKINVEARTVMRVTEIGGSNTDSVVGMAVAPSGAVFLTVFSSSNARASAIPPASAVRRVISRSHTWARCSATTPSPG